MHIDSFTISAIIVGFMALFVLIIAHTNGRREYRQKIAELAKRNRALFNA